MVVCTIARFFRGLGELVEFLVENAAAYYKQQLSLGEKDKGGSSRRDRLLQFYKTTGQMPPDLENELDIDHRVEPFYMAFISLMSYRKISVAGMGGTFYQPLSAEEILAWEELEHNKLGVFGLKVVKALDQVFLDFKTKQRKKEEADQEAKSKVRKNQRGFRGRT